MLREKTFYGPRSATAALALGSLAAHRAVMLVIRVLHDRMAAEVARPHAPARRAGQPPRGWYDLAAAVECARGGPRRTRDRAGLERRLGAGGRALFADALHITALWWNIPELSPPVWEARGRLLGEEAGEDLRLA